MINKSVFKRSAAVLGIVALAAGMAFATSSSAPAVSPEEALQRLMEGNQRYVENQMTGTKLCDLPTRTSLAKSQHPYAVVLTCSDSRVPPEIIFDKGLGEIFVIRVAGNISDPIVLGSIEYAAEHLGSPLIMVLGHERCGAVTAAVNAKGKSSGSKNIDAIVKVVTPAVKAAAKDCQACRVDKKCADTKKDEFVECVVDTNARVVAASLTKNSKILNHLLHENKIRIVAAKYDLDDGRVTLFK